MLEKRNAPSEGANNRLGSKSAQIMEVIVVKSAVGSGTDEDPRRVITEFWSKDGKLLAVADPEVKASLRPTSFG